MLANCLFLRVVFVPAVSAWCYTVRHYGRPAWFADCMLTPDRVPADSPKELYELYFCFCCVWAFGASMFQDQVGS